jgi:hypothetical protein
MSEVGQFRRANSRFDPLGIDLGVGTRRQTQLGQRFFAGEVGESAIKLSIGEIGLAVNRCLVWNQKRSI